MLGAIVGDIVGSRFEFVFPDFKKKEFTLFRRSCKVTDDSIMTLAIADAILKCDLQKDFSTLSNYAIAFMQGLGRHYPNAGYGGIFARWIMLDNPMPYGSYGNGAAMRVSPCAYASESLDTVLEYSDAVTSVTHNHPESIKAARAVTGAIWYALHGCSKDEILGFISNYATLDFTLDEIRPNYKFDVTCQGSVPQALEAFIESRSFEDAIRNAISIGGDSDTIAAITGSIAEAYYGIPDNIRYAAIRFLTPLQKDILDRFESRYGLVADKHREG